MELELVGRNRIATRLRPRIFGRRRRAQFRRRDGTGVPVENGYENFHKKNIKKKTTLKVKRKNRPEYRGDGHTNIVVKK